MELQPTVRSMRSIHDLFELQNQRMQEQREAVNQALEHFVKTEETKTKLAIASITDPEGVLRTFA